MRDETITGRKMKVVASAGDIYCSGGGGGLTAPFHRLKRWVEGEGGFEEQQICYFDS